MLKYCDMEIGRLARLLFNKSNVVDTKWRELSSHARFVYREIVIAFLDEQKKIEDEKDAAIKPCTSSWNAVRQLVHDMYNKGRKPWSHEHLARCLYNVDKRLTQIENKE